MIAANRMMPVADSIASYIPCRMFWAAGTPGVAPAGVGAR